MKELIIYSLASYAITFVVASSSLFEPVRERIKTLLPWIKIGTGKHPIECRMCFGFWASVAVCNTDWKLILPVYGLSYWFACQER
jgi:hypothetical protein